MMKDFSEKIELPSEKTKHISRRWSLFITTLWEQGYANCRKIIIIHQQDFISSVTIVLIC